MTTWLSNQPILTWLPLLALVAGFLLFKKFSQTGGDEAVRLLSGGALLIDVRGPDEFAGGHIAGAVNLPAHGIGAEIRKLAPDPSAPILLHCLSGARSAMACQTLKGMGYTNVHNLGSLGRARSLVAKSGRQP